MTRIDHVLLAAALARVEAELDRLTHDELAQFLVVLSKEDRQHLARPRDGFIPAARVLIHEVRSHAALGNAAGFDAASVVEDLDNVESLTTLISAVTELLRRLEDSRLAWLARAYGPTLTLYKMAKVRAEDDGHLRQVVNPLVEVFAVAAPRRGELATVLAKGEGG